MARIQYMHNPVLGSFTARKPTPWQPNAIKFIFGKWAPMSNKLVPANDIGQYWIDFRTL